MKKYFTVFLFFIFVKFFGFVVVGGGGVCACVYVCDST